MKKSTRKWLRKVGAKVDEQGRPVPAPGPDAHADCDRCGNPCEHPTECYLAGQKFNHLPDGKALVCGDCLKLQWDDSRKFFREGWEHGQ